jgi:hypothetical protein
MAAGWIVNGGSGGGTTDPEAVRDLVGSTIIAGAGVTKTVDDAGNTVTLTVTAGDTSPVQFVEAGDTPADDPGVLYLLLDPLPDAGAPASAPTLVGSRATVFPDGYVNAKGVLMPASGVATGDVLAVFIAAPLDPQFDITPPAGWTDRTLALGGNLDVQLFTRTADGTENGTTPTFSILNGGETGAAVCYHLRGVSAVPNVAKADGFSDTLAVPALTGVPAGAIVLSALGISGTGTAASNPITPPAGWTEDHDIQHGANASTTPKGSAYAHLVATGSVPSGAWTPPEANKLRTVVAAFS